MYVIGTAGHIDHGKTLLIKALTGIDCDRLPEEKEREMTIDLGFAHLELPGIGTVSIIDVPGHERFIRNMVTGAWGIDVGLLVVAADDGWMQQTEDHFRVLQFLGVPRIIAVINKIDLVDEKTVDAIAANVGEILGGSGYPGADIARVSAKTGTGLNELKTLISGNCAHLPSPMDNDRPYLYVDRVFAVKGHGTVVTGTQKNGLFKEGDIATLLPGKKEARLKRIESHNREAPRESSIRAALNCSGISTDEVERGHIIVKKNFFTETDDFIAAISVDRAEIDGGKTKGIEVLVGTAAVPGRIAGVIDDRGGHGRTIVRIQLKHPWFLFPGQRFVVTKTGGFRIYGGGIVVLPRYDKRTMKNAVRERAASLTGFSMNDVLRFVIETNGWLHVETIMGMLPFNESATERIMQSLLNGGSVSIFGDYAVRSDLLGPSIEALKKAISSSPGLHLKEIADIAGLGQDICALLARHLCSKGDAEERGGRYFLKDTGGESALTGPARLIVSNALSSGREGMDLGAARGDEKKIMKELIGRGLLVSLDGNLLWHRDIYDDMKGRIMGLFNTKEKISIGDARDATGLSRKYLIPLLNRIERDGAVKRLGDYRIKP